MEILQVVGSVVCTLRHPDLQHSNLRVLRSANGKTQVSIDTIGARDGSWVFVISGTAARLACGDPSIVTDLAIGGVIDFWDEDSGQLEEPA